MSIILVTGAAGVIGQHLVPYLDSKGHIVIGTDIARHGGCIKADVSSYKDMAKLMAKTEPEILIHMAGEVGIKNGEEHPDKMVQVNAVGTQNIVELCTENGVDLVYFSTSEVYGHSLDARTHVTEDEPLGALNTTNIYAMSKLFGEAIVKHYVENYQLSAVTVRPFMVYGPGEYPTIYRSAISRMVYRALTGKTIVAHIGAVRAWCYIDDFVKGVELVMEKAKTRRYEAYNIGSDEAYSMEKVAQRIQQIAGRGTVALTEPPNQFVNKVKIASIEKARAIGYDPKVTLVEGLQNVIDWQRKEVIGEDGDDNIDT